MSDLAKKLEQASRRRGQPLGFGIGSKDKASPMVAIAEMGDVDADLISSVMKSKVDAMLVDINGDGGQIDTLREVMSSMEAVVWGVHVSNPDQDALGKLVAAGCDYVVMGMEAAASVLADEKLGKVLKVETSVSDGIAGTMEGLPVDAVLLLGSDGTEPLPVSRLLQYRRIVGLSGKPGIVKLGGNVPDIGTFAGDGICGVVVEVTRGNVQRMLLDVDAAIEKLR